jgi:hypothetical protein
VPQRFSSTSLGGPAASVVPQENTRLHSLVDRIFQEVDKIKREQSRRLYTIMHKKGINEKHREV